MRIIFLKSFDLWVVTLNSWKVFLFCCVRFSNLWSPRTYLSLFPFFFICTCFLHLIYIHSFISHLCGLLFYCPGLFIFCVMCTSAFQLFVVHRVLCCQWLCQFLFSHPAALIIYHYWIGLKCPLSPSPNLHSRTFRSDWTSYLFWMNILNGS